ncbi:MAG: ABC transporter permease [Bacteroidia bacterium]|nr:ABC transporter permease [Bacteroidia bacterium]
MCVITSLFLGLIISAEEIVKDRKILKRESFLNLSWFSYLNSKIMIMFLISAIQTISFILIGNLILEIRGMTFAYWIVLFTTSCLANMMGLNISSAFNSVITIYILIPFILIPQLLFSGVLVKFDKLHTSNHSSSEFVPIIGDMMPARWSFEALAVEQYKNNKYERNFFKSDMGKSQNFWYATFLIDALKNDLSECRDYKDSIQMRSTVKNNFTKLNFYIDQLTGLAGFDSSPENLKASLNIGSFNSSVAKDASKYLDSLARRFWRISDNARLSKDSVYKSIIAKIGREELINLSSNYYNKRLEIVVLDRDRIDQSIETQKRIIQKYEPGYMKSISKYGRAQFYAPYKQIGNTPIDTFWFNMLVLWLVTLVLYIALYYNLLQKVVTYFENVRITKSDRQGINLS